MKAVIWGYGVLGSRYAGLLKAQNVEVRIVTRRTSELENSFPTIQEALKGFPADWVFVCTETQLHAQNLQELKEVGYKDKVFVEKPMFNDYQEFDTKCFSKLVVGYNLRLHPLVRGLKKDLAGQRIMSAEFHVGQFLPNWRPGQDYRRFYSAHRSKGGGVLRDLSHELDLALFFFGRPLSVKASLKKITDLEIDVEDTADLRTTHVLCPNVKIHLNYWEPQPIRIARIQTDRQRYELNLVKNTLKVGRDEIPGDSPVKLTYEAMVKSLVSNQFEGLCTDEDGLTVVKMITAAELSQVEKRRIQL